MEFPNHSRRSFLAAVLAVGAGIALRSTGVAAMQAATPAAGFPVSLLDRAPDPGVSLTSETSVYATFADLVAETIATGAERPDGMADEAKVIRWVNALRPLALPNRLGSFFLEPRFVEFTGFDITQVDQTAEIGQPPEVVSMYAGRFDRAAVLAAWEAATYREVQSGDIAIWSLSEDNSFSPDNPVQRIFLSGHNNAALIGENLIIFAPELPLLKNAVAAATGDGNSIGQNELAARLLAVSPDVVTGALVNGASLMTSLDPGVMLDADSADEAATAIAEQMEQPQMAPILLAMIGVTGGGPIPMANSADATPIPTPETAMLEIALLMPSTDAATEAVGIALDRLETMDSQVRKQPYSRIFQSWGGGVAADPSVALLTLTFGEAMPSHWMNMLYDRDYRFIG